MREPTETTAHCDVTVDPRGWRDPDQSTTRIYVWPENENVLTNFMVGRRNRPVDAYRKVLLDEVLPALGIENAKVGWRRKAGCSCGCSPGFVLVDTDGRQRSHRVQGMIADIHVTIRRADHECDFSTLPVCSTCGTAAPEVVEAISEAAAAAEDPIEGLRRLVEAGRG